MKKFAVLGTIVVALGFGQGNHASAAPAQAVEPRRMVILDPDWVFNPDEIEMGLAQLARNVGITF